MVNTDRLRKEVKTFKAKSSHIDSSGRATCTAADLNKVVRNVENVLEAFIEELEASQKRD